jgi:hypothetical protein
MKTEYLGQSRHVDRKRYKVHPRQLHKLSERRARRVAARLADDVGGEW